MYKWTTLLIFDSSFSSHFLTKFIIVNVTAGSCSLPLSPLLSPPTQHKYDITLHLVHLHHLKILALNEMTHLTRFLATGDPPRLTTPCTVLRNLLIPCNAIT